MLSFVYGQAQLGGPVALLSLARLRQEFYGLGPNTGLFLSRVRKETLHEVGHTYGLTHCGDARCTMALSTDVRHVDAKNEEFCSGCAILLREATGPCRRRALGVHREKELGHSRRRRRSGDAGIAGRVACGGWLFR